MNVWKHHVEVTLLGAMHHVEVLLLGAMHAAFILPCFTFILPCINIHSFEFILQRSSDQSV